LSGSEISDEWNIVRQSLFNSTELQHEDLKERLREASETQRSSWKNLVAEEMSSVLEEICCQFISNSMN